MNRFQLYLVEEFAEDYQEGHLSRRDALKLIASVSGSLLLANSMLAACAPVESTPSATALTALPPTPESSLESSTAAPQASAGGTAPPQGTVSPDDPAVDADDIEFEGAGATLMGYQAHPVMEGSFPAVLVCHENRGLTDHIRDVARRLAKAGYAALAVDLLSRQGGTGAFTSDEVPGILGNTPPEQFVQDFQSGWSYLKSQPYVDPERVGMVGFCFGGGVTWLVAAAMPDLRAAVPFYGPHPPAEEAADIQAAVLAVYAGRDARINQGIPAIESAMNENGKTYEKIIYPDVDHAFHNDTGGRYNAEAAQDAWSRTLDWFGRYLS